MTVLVDDAMWPWRGQRWAHLASDSDLDELHAFADALGLRRLGFQGDHYDVPAPLRDRAIALGAVPVGGRELVRRLRAAGLRRRGGGIRWERALAVTPPARFTPELLADTRAALASRIGEGVAYDLVGPLAPLASLAPALAELGLAVLHRSGEVAVALDLDGAHVPASYAPDTPAGTVRWRRPGSVWAFEAVISLP